MNENKEFLPIVIDFEQSHLFFPRIIVGLIIILLMFIGIKELVKHLHNGSLKVALKGFRFFEPGFDKMKLFGTMISIFIYFVLMDLVSRLFPNRGWGFLSTSIPFMIVMSVLLVGRKKVKKHVISILISSIVTPVSAWIIFGKLFFITLP